MRNGARLASIRRLTPARASGERTKEAESKKGPAAEYWEVEGKLNDKPVSIHFGDDGSELRRSFYCTGKIGAAD